LRTPVPEHPHFATERHEPHFARGPRSGCACVWPTRLHRRKAPPRIFSLLPNPAGNESQNETAKIRNIGSAPAALVGWRLRDLAGQVWSLDSLGTPAAGTERMIQRLGQPKAMNNGGDTIDLIDPNGTVVQTVTYGGVDEGELVTPAVP